MADKNFAVLKSDPRHPSLHFKQVVRPDPIEMFVGLVCIAVGILGRPTWISRFVSLAALKSYCISRERDCPH